MLERIIERVYVEVDQKIDDSFSKDINLFDYQMEALEKSLKFLTLAYDDGVFDKQKLFALYDEEIDTEELKLNDIQIGDGFLSEKLLGHKQDEIGFYELTNRCSYWMATGSGKSLVMIKLIELLDGLMEEKIPKNNILILAPTEEILSQLQGHIEKYNAFHTSKPINLVDLRQFDGKVADNRGSITVYFYRSNNIVDTETKEKELNYEEFFNDGRWYLILDEAHKGESSRNLSKRKALFTLIAKQGVIFNFSATFADDLDKVTTLFDFKLDKFLRAGYGKKLMLMESSVSVKEDDQLENIAKSLMVLAQARKDYEKIKKYGNYYHAPLMMTIANKVNTENADLKIFFEKLALIAKEAFDFEKVKQDLNYEIKKDYLFSMGKLTREVDISKDEFYRYVFNAPGPAEIEYAFSKNRNELIFNLKNSDEYFMLIYAGDVVKWGDDFLAGYEAKEKIDDGVFKNLDQKEEISILLGSRMFIEGWDTNRVNIVNFVELGKSDAEKLVLQAIGRGVRIEPVRNKRKRLIELDDEEKADIAYFNEIVKYVDFIETLFIFPSKKEYLERVLEGLEKVSNKKECKEFHWLDEEDVTKETFLCVPIWQKGDKVNDKPFYVSRDSAEELKNYVDKYDDATFILKHHIATRTLRKIKEGHFRHSSRTVAVKNLIEMLDSFWNERIEELSGMKILTNEIQHYQRMCAILGDEDIQKLEEDLRWILQEMRCPDDKKEEERLKLTIQTLQEEYIEEDIINKIKHKLQNIKSSMFFPELLECIVMKEHFYIPLLHVPTRLLNELESASKKRQKNKLKNLREKISIFSHVIKHRSEVEFLKKLEEYYKKDHNKLKAYDKWIFSKVEEKIDNIKIPYFDSKRMSYKNFYPDFIFWLKNGEKKKIIFVDPKGVEHTQNARDKVEGFKEFQSRIENDTLKVKLFFFNEDVPDSEVKEYWSSDFDEIFD